jgi:hypothetical protein
MQEALVNADHSSALLRHLACINDMYSSICILYKYIKSGYWCVTDEASHITCISGTPLSSRALPTALAQ